MTDIEWGIVAIVALFFVLYVALIWLRVTRE